MDKNGHFLTTYPSHLVHGVFEWTPTTGQKSLQFLVHILGEMMTSPIHSEIYWSLAVSFGAKFQVSGMNCHEFPLFRNWACNCWIMRSQHEFSIDYFLWFSGLVWKLPNCIHNLMYLDLLTQSWVVVPKRQEKHFSPDFKFNWQGRNVNVLQKICWFLPRPACSHRDLATTAEVRNFSIIFPAQLLV